MPPKLRSVPYSILYSIPRSISLAIDEPAQLRWPLAPDVAQRKARTAAVRTDRRLRLRQTRPGTRDQPTGLVAERRTTSAAEVRTRRAPNAEALRQWLAVARPAARSGY